MITELKKPSITVLNNIYSSKWIWFGVPAFLLIGLAGILVYNYHAVFTVEKLVAGINQDFFIYLIIGIFAQLVDCPKAIYLRKYHQVIFITQFFL